MLPAARVRPWAVLLGGAVMVAVVAGAGRWLGRSDVHSAAVGTVASRSVADGVRLVFVLAVVVGLVCTLVVGLSGGAGGNASSGSRRQISFVRAAIMTLASLASALVVLVILRWLFPPHQVPTNGPVAVGTPHGSAGAGGGGYAGDWPLVLAVAVVVVLAVIGAAVVARSRRHVAVRSAGDTGRPTGSPASALAFDPDAEHDPRRAVIAVYHWVLAVLEAHGRGRRDSEAPFEHVERVLGEPAGLLGPGRTVAGAFELARYSEHDVPVELRADVVAAARRVVAQVEGPIADPDPA